MIHETFDLMCTLNIFAASQRSLTFINNIGSAKRMIGYLIMMSNKHNCLDDALILCFGFILNVSSSLFYRSFLSILNNRFIHQPEVSQRKNF